MTGQLSYTTQTLAMSTGMSTKYIAKCIHSAGGPGNPPVLRAKRGPRGFIITARDAEAWLDAHEDA